MYFLSVGRAALAVTGVLALSAGVASAADSVSWTTGLVSVDTSTPAASWISPTAVDAGATGYQYSYVITVADVQILGTMWQSALGELGDDATGGGTFAALPVSLLSGSVSDDTVGISGTVSLGVDASGFGYLNLTNFSFTGLATAARVNATVDVTPVPEPSTIGLVGLIGGALLTRRRTRVA